MCDTGPAMDRRAIVDVLHRYAVLLDTGQSARIPAEVFAPDAVEDHGAGLAPTRGAEALAAWLSSALAPFAAVMHALSTIVVEVEGDRATSRTYYQAFHWLAEGGDPDGAVDWMSVGLYLDEWRRTDAGWRIAHRRRRNVGPGSDVIGRRPHHLRGPDQRHHGRDSARRKSTWTPPSW